MTVLEQISNTYLASLVLGLQYGLTFCASACLPYIVRYIAGIGAGFKTSIKIKAVYNSGRIVAYAIIGTAVGLVGTVITEEILASYQQYTSITFGAIATVIGAAIILKKIETCNFTQRQPQSDRFGLSKLTTKFDLRAFSFGLSRGLIVCPPLVALLLCSLTISQVNCTAMAILFGAGTALSPVLFLGGVSGGLLNTRRYGEHGFQESEGHTHNNGAEHLGWSSTRLN
jgi:sulfite exporter TauE/SafE